MFSRLLSCMLLLFCPLAPGASPENPEITPGLRHERIMHQSVEYDVAWVDLREAQIELYWKRPDGEPFRSFSRLREWLGTEGRSLLFATNSGIYARDRSPLGLHIEQGEELQKLNLGKGGRGNFFLKPNGVFHITAKEAAVTPAPDFEALQVKPALAVQSGPMLVINGELHPRFLKDATSTHFRNGVGVRGAHEVAFAISRAPVIFHDFATLFRDKLKCTDALYLDGTLSAMYLPAAGRHDPGIELVGILAVTAPEQE